jgi:hypothetical protein
MKSVLNRKESVIWASVIASTLACFALGLKMASGAPLPACPNPCPCRDLTFWQPPGGRTYGAFQTGGGPAKLTTTTGMPNVNTTNACQALPFTQVGVFDLWIIPNSTPTCNAGNSLFVTELNVTPMQLGIVPGTLQMNQIRNQCS